MTGFHLDPYRRAKAVRYLLLRWRPEAIAREINCSKTTIFNMQRNLWLYGSTRRPFRRVMGCPRKITHADEKRLVDFLVRNPTANQEEITWFLWEECGI
jgi:hypothetical protein